MKKLVGLLGMGALGSQAGHLLVYQLQFGSTAPLAQSQGAHAYFPLVAKTSLGVAAFVFITVLLVTGAGRFASGTSMRNVSSPPLIRLLSGLFAIQLAIFVIQETLEALVVGSPAPHVLVLVFLGTLGQLPVAGVTALAIKWLAARFELAVASLRLEPVTSAVAILAEAVVLPRLQLVAQNALAESCPSSFAKRGPPPILRA